MKNLLRVKLIKQAFNPELNWKVNNKYWAKQISDNEFEVYYPGSPIISIFPKNYLEVI